MKAAEIGEEASIPLRFLFKILGELREAGLVIARRGYYGGYVLSRAPGEIHLDEICRAVGRREFFEPLEGCAVDGRSPGLDLVWLEIRNFAIERLRRATVEELCSADGARPPEIVGG